MTEYIISLLGTRRYVYVLDADERPSDFPAAEGLCLIPDSKSRFDLTVNTVGNLHYPKWELCMLLSFFVQSILGYPLCELNINLDNEPINLELFDTPRGFAGLIVDKCKLLFTSNYIAPDLTEHKIFTAHANGIFRVLHVENCEGFRPEILSTLKTVSTLPTASMSVGVCDGKIILAAGEKINPYVLTAVALTVAEGGCETVSLRHGEITFSVILRGESSTVLTPAFLVKTNKI